MKPSIPSFGDNAKDEHRQERQLALEYLAEAWNTAEDEGVESLALAHASLFAAIATLVRAHGEEAVEPVTMRERAENSPSVDERMSRVRQRVLRILDSELRRVGEEAIEHLVVLGPQQRAGGIHERATAADEFRRRPQQLTLQDRQLGDIRRPAPPADLGMLP